MINQGLLNLISITESWLNKSITDSKISIHGYCVVPWRCMYVFMYVRDIYTFTVREDIAVTTNEKLYG